MTILLRPDGAEENDYLREGFGACTALMRFQEKDAKRKDSCCKYLFCSISLKPCVARKIVQVYTQICDSGWRELYRVKIDPVILEYCPTRNLSSKSQSELKLILKKLRGQDVIRKLEGELEFARKEWGGKK